MTHNLRTGRLRQPRSGRQRSTSASCTRNDLDRCLSPGQDGSNLSPGECSGVVAGNLEATSQRWRIGNALGLGEGEGVLGQEVEMAG